MIYEIEIRDRKKQLIFYKESYPKILRKLKEYEDMEEKGLLVKLPLKVGDIVIKDNVEFKVHTLSYNVREINLSNCHIRYFASPCNDELEEIDDIWFWDDDIGNRLLIKKS